MEKKEWEKREMNREEIDIKKALLMHLQGEV